jgi:hypothetical protein
MIIGNDRLIVVLGMAHSGTTIVAYILRQHPDVVVAVGGYEGWILENTWLPREESQPIQNLLNENPDKRVLLKRPWNEVHHPEWMHREMPDATFIYCVRPFEAISQSWSRRNSFVDSRLRNGGVHYQRLFYQMSLAKGNAFGRTVQHFHVIENGSFIAKPAQTMQDIASWVGLAPWEFDVSTVSSDKNIKRILSRERRMKAALENKENAAKNKEDSGETSLLEMESREADNSTTDEAVHGRSSSQNGVAGDSGQMRIMIGTICTPEMSRLGQQCAALMRQYARKHGYGLIIQESSLDSTRRPAWGKILLIQKHLHECDWFFWIDADAAILNQDIRLESIIDEACDFIVADDLPNSPINTGVFLIRNGETSKSFLVNAYGKTEFLTHANYEQPALVASMKETPGLRAKIVPRSVMNAFRREYVSGMFIKHFAGGGKPRAIKPKGFQQAK